MKKVHFIIPIILILTNNSFGQNENFNGKEISFPSMDGLEITADFYPTEKKDAPYIILFHQANFSRGSYRTIAPKLNSLGFNCLAIDQRSGNMAQGVINETNKRAVAKKMPSKYVNAIPDVEAALMYVKNELKAKQIIIWGSSYSASLVIYLGSKYTDDVDGILSFSPGEYFEINDQKIESFATRIVCPVFITSAKNEKSQWNDIYEKIPSDKVYFLPKQGGAHGSKALWADKNGNREYWEAVTSFLKKFEQ